MTDTLQNNTRYDDCTFEALNLEHQKIDVSTFVDCTFIRCHLIQAILSGCRFINVEFLHCDLSVMQIPGSTFSGCRIEHCKSIGIDWTVADWTMPSLGTPINFIHSDLSESTFLGLSLKKIQMEQCTLHNVDFREVNLSEANCTGSDFDGSLFGKTNLSLADFRGAIHYQIDPMGNTINGAKFSLPEVLSLLYALDIEIGEFE